MTRRKPYTSPTVKASILVDARTHALWGACAHMSGMDRTAFAIKAITEACRQRGIVLADKRNPKGQAKAKESATAPDPVEPEGPEDAA